MQFRSFLSFSLVLVLAGLLWAVNSIGSTNGPILRKYSAQPAAEPEIHEGDLIFQSSSSGQSTAVKLATHSRYSHCGIIFKKGKEFYVLEAVQPVCETKLSEWIERGDDGHYLIKRLKNSEILTSDVLNRMKEIGSKFLNKNYDLAFEWTDDKMYCSELIWKIYQRGAGVEIGPLRPLSDFDLSHPAVKAKLKERYGNEIPLEEKMISPGDIAANPELITVRSN